MRNRQPKHKEKTAHKTKQTILECAVSLFAALGYESVSMKDIANAVGIRPASIYNHYRAKEAILSDVYEYFRQNIRSPQLAEEEYLPILRSGSAEEIVNIINFTWSAEQNQPLNMFDVVRVVWARTYIDERASEVYRTCVLEEGMRYASAVLGKAVEIGRVRCTPEEIELLSANFLAIRVFSANGAVVEPDQMKWRRIETDMLEMAFRAVPLLPPLPPETEKNRAAPQET